MGRELDTVREGRGLTLVFDLIRRHPGHRLGRYAKTYGRITWRQQQMVRPEEPQLARPAQPSRRLPAANRQNVSSRLRRVGFGVVSWQYVFDAHLQAARECFHEL